MIEFPQKVFRAYDVRGLVGSELTPELAYELGRAIGTKSIRRNGSQLSVGRDCRTHSPSFHRSLIDGLLSTGTNVMDLGIVPSPLVYFSLFHRHNVVDGGVMITGSHNPKEFNGFKICLGQSSIHGDDIQELRQMIATRDYEVGSGTSTDQPILRDYINYVKANLSFRRHNLKVVIDPGNGTAGPVIEPSHHVRIHKTGPHHMKVPSALASFEVSQHQPCGHCTAHFVSL